jgi:hypothetical protein
VRYRMGQNVIKGRYYFESNGRVHSAQGYWAPESRLESVKIAFGFMKIA